MIEHLRLLDPDCAMMVIVEASKMLLPEERLMILRMWDAMYPEDGVKFPTVH